MFDWIFEMDTQSLVAMFGVISAFMTSVGGYFIWTQRRKIKEIESKSEIERTKRDQERTERLRIDREFQEFKSQVEQTNALISVIDKMAVNIGRLAENVAHADKTQRESYQLLANQVKSNTQAHEWVKEKLPALDEHLVDTSAASQDMAKEMSMLSHNIQELIIGIRERDGKQDERLNQYNVQLTAVLERLNPLVSEIETRTKEIHQTEVTKPLVEKSASGLK